MLMKASDGCKKITKKIPAPIGTQSDYKNLGCLSFTRASQDVYHITMKLRLIFLLFLLQVPPAFATTPDEIMGLIQLKTSDDVLLQLIYASPLEQPLTPSQVIELKKSGVSERVLSTLLKVSRPNTLPKQESESYWIDESARYYYTTTESGEKKIVLTNLDEKGNRMGPPPPPRREPDPEEPVRQPVYPAPQPVDYAQRSATSSYSNISNEYPSSGYNPYFVPDFPGSSFGFHLLPQFTVIHPSFGFGRHPFPHCSKPPKPVNHSFRRFSR
jgi:hypothetical protein